MANRITVAQLIDVLRTMPQENEVWSLDDISGDAVYSPVTLDMVHLDAENRISITGDSCER